MVMFIINMWIRNRLISPIHTIMVRAGVHDTVNLEIHIIRVCQIFAKKYYNSRIILIIVYRGRNNRIMKLSIFYNSRRSI